MDRAQARNSDPPALDQQIWNRKFRCVPAIAGAQNGDSLADVSVDGADAQTQFEGDFLGGLEPIDMAEALALARGQAFAESDARLPARRLRRLTG